MCNSSQVWWDVSSTGQARAFEGEIPNPFKVSARSPFLDVPGVSVESIKTDVMHTFNLGVGGDLSSSAIVALCKLNFFPGRSLQSRMDAAYEDFSSWCVLNQKTASTKSFEKKRFHMKSNLGSCLIYIFLFVLCVGVLLYAVLAHGQHKPGTMTILKGFLERMMWRCSANGWGHSWRTIPPEPRWHLYYKSMWKNVCVHTHVLVKVEYMWA